MSDSPGRREVAFRVFAAEFDGATVEHTESDEERAPNYVVTPGGARVNRLFFVGVLTEVEQVSEDVLRGRVVDPTGAFVLYAGQYQPDEQTFLERAEPPTFVAVTGKARTFQPEDGDRVFTSVRPESINEVDADARDRWVVDTAARTLERVATMASALESDPRGDDLEEHLLERGHQPGVAAGVPLAIEHYGTTPFYLAGLRDLALDAARVVAGEVDEVAPLDRTPDDRGDADLAALVEAAPEGATAGGLADEAATTSGRAVAEETTGTDLGDDPPAGGADTVSTEAETTEEAAGADAETTGTGSTEAERTGGESGGVTAETAETAERAGGDVEPDHTISDDDLGDFESSDLGGSEAESDDGPATDVEAESDEMYELDEEERQEVEEEYGTEFSTGAEVASGDDDLPEEDVEPADAGVDSETPPPDTGVDTDEETAATTDPEAQTTATDTAGDSDAGTDESDTDTDDSTTDASGTGPDGAADVATASTGVEREADDAGTDASDADTGEDTTEDIDLEEAVVETMDALDDGDGAGREELIAAVVDDTGADPDAVEDAIQAALMGGRCYEPTDGRLKSI